MRTHVVVDLVVPCYNEAQALPETHRHLVELMESLFRSGMVSEQSKICYVDDGSRDRTWDLICAWCRTDSKVSGIRLSRNFGHQAALLAGLFSSRGDAVITIDADLQDDIAVVPEMVVRYCRGDEVVLGVRRARVSDSFFKRNSAGLYYGLLGRMGVGIVPNHADYRFWPPGDRRLE